MREIKFRAYHKNWKRMFDVEGLLFSDNELILDMGSDFTEVENIDEVELMQYTGLKDKSGVEIYEGDILFWTSKVMNKEKWYGVVETLGADCIVRTSKSSYNNGSWLNSASKSEAIEVIGNIYENPEILGGVIKK